MWVWSKKKKSGSECSIVIPPEFRGSDEVVYGGESGTINA